MVGFFVTYFLGARIWMWCLLIWVMGLVIFLVLYLHREKIKEKYYKIRWPERVIKIIIHHPNNHYKVYWRLIPNTEQLKRGDELYAFDKAAIVKEELTFFKKLNQAQEELYFKLGLADYRLPESDLIKEQPDLFLTKKGVWPEIHYCNGNPNPIDFSQYTGELKFTTNALAQLKKNDLFQKLLTLAAERQILIFLIVLVVGDVLIGIFHLAHDMGWIK